jgi:hypothetical protein
MASGEGQSSNDDHLSDSQPLQWTGGKRSVKPVNHSPGKTADHATRYKKRATRSANQHDDNIGGIHRSSQLV